MIHSSYNSLYIFQTRTEKHFSLAEFLCIDIRCLYPPFIKCTFFHAQGLFEQVSENAVIGTAKGFLLKNYETKKRELRPSPNTTRKIDDIIILWYPCSGFQVGWIPPLLCLIACRRCVPQIHLAVRHLPTSWWSLPRHLTLISSFDAHVVINAQKREHLKLNVETVPLDFTSKHNITINPPLLCNNLLFNVNCQKLFYFFSFKKE